MNLAPICIFVYNRPNHTRLTLEALKQNDLASDSILYIFSDGPKNTKDQLKIKEVRNIIRKEQWCKNVKIFESRENLGLAKSIIDGVTQIINKHERIIVLEDDIITSSGFLTYMNKALNLYESESKVMHISGYMFPTKKRNPETFFLNLATCWGWGTWARAWKYLERNPEKLLSNFTSTSQIKHFNLDGAYNWYDVLQKNCSGEIKTWAIKWYASFYLKNGFVLHPGRSLCRNIGCDNSGVHCNTDNELLNQTIADFIQINQIELIENQTVRKLVKRYFTKKNLSNLGYLKYKLYKK